MITKDQVEKKLELSKEELETLSFVYNAFKERGEWPGVRTIHKECGEENANKLLSRIKPSLIYKQRNDDSREIYKLTFEGMFFCPSAEKDLQILERFLNILIEKFKLDVEVTKISAAEVNPVLQLNEAEARTLITLIHESNFAGSGSYGSDWLIEVPYDIEKLVKFGPRQYILDHLRLKPDSQSNGSTIKEVGKNTEREVDKVGTSIFISHSEKDKLLAEELVKLLVLGASVNKSEIFCTSLEGMGIQKGENFTDFIKENLQQPKLVIILLTPNYYESIFCLCELGASWILSHETFPIIVPPLDYDDVKAVLEGIEVARINNESDMNELKDKVNVALKRSSPTAMWAKELKEFFVNLSPIIIKLPKPNKIGLHRHMKLEEKLELTESKLAIAEKRIQELKGLNDRLVSAKDKEEVTKIVIGQMDNWEAFRELVGDVLHKKNLLKNNEVALEATFHYIADSQYIIHQFDDYLREELDEAVESDFVTFDDSTNEIRLVEDDPAVMEFLTHFNLIVEFIKKADSEFEKIFIETYKVKLDFSNRRFWEALGIL